MPRHDLILAIFDVGRWHGKNDLVDHGSCLQHPQGLNDERLTTDRKKLFRNKASHSKPSARGWHKRHHQRTPPVCLVCFVCLVDVVHLVFAVSLIQLNKQDKPNKLNKPNKPAFRQPVMVSA
jgi:hypothetical protein